MGSSFVDLDATSTAVKTDLDLDAQLERYFIFRVRIQKKRKSKHRSILQFKQEPRTVATCRAGESKGEAPREVESHHVQVAAEPRSRFLERALFLVKSFLPVSFSISVVVIREIRYALVTISLAIPTHMPLPVSDSEF